MAEVLLRRAAADMGLVLSVSSAGTDAGGLIHPRAATAVRYLEDIEGRECVQVSGSMLEQADLVLVMDRTQLEDHLLAPFRAKVYLLKEFAGGTGTILDPFQGTQPQYDACRDELAQAVKEVVARLFRHS